MDIEVFKLTKPYIPSDESNGGKLYRDSGLLVGPNSDVGLKRLQQELSFIWDCKISGINSSNMFYRFLVEMLPPQRLVVGSDWRFGGNSKN